MSTYETIETIETIKPAKPEPITITLSEIVLQLTGNGHKIVAFLLSVMDGNESASMKERIRASEILLDRGFGRPVESIYVHQDVKHRLMESWSDDELKSLVDMRRMITGIVDPTKIVEMPMFEPKPDLDLSLDSKSEATESSL